MDYSEKKTEQELNMLERNLKKEYNRAYVEMKAKANEYFSVFDDRVEAEYKKYLAGEYTDTQFKNWYMTQVARGEKYNALAEDLANKMLNANQIASQMINGKLAGVYTLNANYTSYQISQDYDGISFGLVSENTIKALMDDETNFTDFKTTSIDPVRDYKWNTKQVKSALASGIIQGKSTKELANSLMVVMQRNKNSAIRNARTAITSAQNAGKLASMNQAKELGIETQKMWISAGDRRVRDSHAHLDGQIRDLDEFFDNDLMFPSDPGGRPEEVYNCRCGMKYVHRKYHPDWKSKEDYSETKQDGETYQEWLKRMGQVGAENDDDIGSHVLTLMNKKATKEAKAIAKTLLPETRMKKIGKLVHNYIDSPTNWSGELKYNPKLKVLGRYDLITHDIIRGPRTTIKTEIHEYIHSCTDRSGVTRLDKRINGKINEGGTELLAREICKEHGIHFNPTRDEVVNPLINIANGLKVSNMDIARLINNTHYSQKYSTIESLINMANVTTKERENLLEELKKVHGAMK